MYEQECFNTLNFAFKENPIVWVSVMISTDSELLPKKKKLGYKWVFFRINAKQNFKLVVPLTSYLISFKWVDKSPCSPFVLDYTPGIVCNM